MTMPELAAVPDTGPELPEGPFAGTDSALGLTLPKLRVRPASGEVYEVQAYNPDMLLFEETAQRHKWEGPSKAPFRWITFLAWAASVREKQTTLGWEEFRRSTLEIVNTLGTPATPTPPGPVPG